MNHITIFNCSRADVQFIKYELCPLDSITETSVTLLTLAFSNKCSLK